LSIRDAVLWFSLGTAWLSGCGAADSGDAVPVTASVHYRSLTVNGVSIFFREAGDPKLPTLVMLHGFPASSYQYRDLIAELSDRFHVIAPDYPGFGQSAAPAASEFAYTFDALADGVDGLLGQLGVARFALYVHDYGAPVGERLMLRHPDAITALIVQNGIAYTDGLTDALKPLMAYWQDRAANEQAVRNYLAPETTRFIFLNGAQDPAAISPDNWTLAQAALDRPGNDLIQLALFYDYRTNLAVFQNIQTYFRARSPRTLIVWGKGDPFFTEEAARAYLRDLPAAELHILDTGHFALEERHAEIATLIRAFADRTPGLAAR